MTDTFGSHTSSEIDCDLMSSSCSDDGSNDDVLQQLETDMVVWLQYCHIAERIVHQYLVPDPAHRYLFSTTRSGHIFMLQNMHGYRQVQTLFGHSLQIVGHYFKCVLRAIGALAADMIRPHENYNPGAVSHHPDPQRYPLFQDCIGAIDGTYVWAVLPRRKRINFIGRKEVPTQNVLATCDFNLCFTFVLQGSMRPTHDSHILARAVHSPDIHFSKSTDGKYYLVDSGFAHRSGYMAPYKGSDVRYHFQEFHNHGGGRRRLRNARERFNFHHSSCGNIIERAFGVWKQRWKILDRMPSYSYRAQIGVVVAAMGVYNFLRRNGQLDEGFRRAEEVDDEEVEVELPDEKDKAAAEEDAVADENVSWTQLRDYIAHTIR
ncbi:uncharacterized protein LOC111379508 [Olea europaea var. sylvestris]|uniref:uncharacterized protein LOC111379508 n=1 Tax=Olea europaea var. sylvestris TaxID=158386 RepID=UPI000C1D6EA8|nr:uncharacterized protein LOC111379508 [Olea europaea var. sylvestris]